MQPAHLKGSQSPPAHTHAAVLSAELGRMEPSPPSEQAFLGRDKVLLCHVQTDRGDITNSAACLGTQSILFLCTSHQPEIYLLTFSILLTTPLNSSLSSASTTGSNSRRKTRRNSVENMVSLQPRSRPCGLGRIPLSSGQSCQSINQSTD